MIIPLGVLKCICHYVYVIMKTSKVCVQCQFMFGGGGKDTWMYVATPVLFVCVHGCAGLCVCVSLCSIRLSMRAVLDYAGYCWRLMNFMFRLVKLLILRASRNQ